MSMKFRLLFNTIHSSGAFAPVTVGKLKLVVNLVALPHLGKLVRCIVRLTFQVIKDDQMESWAQHKSLTFQVITRWTFQSLG